MTVKCPKCGEVTDYSYLNKCKCGCEFIVLASEEGLEVVESKFDFNDISFGNDLDGRKIDIIKFEPTYIKVDVDTGNISANVVQKTAYEVMKEVMDKERTSKGFTIKCNECGKETVFTKSGDYYDQNNDLIYLDSWGYTYETQEGIWCKCGNKVGGADEE